MSTVIAVFCLIGVLVLHVRHDSPDPADPVARSPNGKRAARVGDMEFVARLLNENPGKGQKAGAELIAALCERDDFPAALALARFAPAGISADWTASIFACHALKSPVEALAAWRELPAGESRDAAFSALAASWSQVDAAGLAAAALAFGTDSAERRTALLTASHGWARQDPAAFTVWLNELQQPKEFSMAVSALVQETIIARPDPLEALGWLATLPDSPARLSAAAGSYAGWARSDPDAARAWLTDCPDPAILQAALSGPPPPPPAHAPPLSVTP